MLSSEAPGTFIGRPVFRMAAPAANNLMSSTGGLGACAMQSMCEDYKDMTLLQYASVIEKPFGKCPYAWSTFDDITGGLIRTLKEKKKKRSIC